MTDKMPDELWRDFPRTAPEFEARFKTEEDWRRQKTAADDAPTCRYGPTIQQVRQVFRGASLN